MKTIVHKVLILLAAACGASSAIAQTPSWQVSEVSGDVRVVEGGNSRPAMRGMLLSSGSTIATAARARAVLTRGQEYVVISPSSRLQVPAPAQQRSGVIQMLTDWGTALFRIERRATPHFGVQTPYLAAVVKGTVFTVTVGEAGGSVQVTEGAVEVSTNDGGAVELVRPGMIASVSATDLQLLNIEGETSRSIRSNGTPSAGAVTVPVPQAGSYEGPSAQVIEITAAVTEEPVSLAETTGGLISGTLGFELALADVVDSARVVVQPDPAPPAGGGQAGASEGGATPLPADDDAAAPPPPPADDDVTPPPPPPADEDATPPSDDDATPPSADDGNNGHGNDDDGDDDSNPGNGHGNGNDGNSGRGGDDDGAVDPPTSPPGDDGNNGHGNADDGEDDSNPGRGGPGPDGGDRDDGNSGHGNDEDGFDDGNPGYGHGRDDDDRPGRGPGRGGGLEICLPADLLCIGLGRDDDRDPGHGRGRGDD